ncbi:MAG: hypothetical protein HY706_18485 [Candidatus Hydrogenedentes bacterium]|nr:hypothetical protein [Candidatus Hydrogenedentota bacterium]
MSDRTDDESHLRLLAIFYWVLGGLKAIFACLPLVWIAFGMFMFLGSNTFTPSGPNAPPPELITLFGVIVLTIGVFSFLFSLSLALAMLYAARCLYYHRKWTYCLVVAAIGCISIPFGTVLGVFTIIVLNRPSVKELFALELPPGP